LAPGFEGVLWRKHEFHVRGMGGIDPPQLAGRRANVVKSPGEDGSLSSRSTNVEITADPLRGSPLATLNSIAHLINEQVNDAPRRGGYPTCVR
jgi:hypothetical protein